MIVTLSAWVAVALSSVPQDAGTLSFTTVTINRSPGDQYDPHVDADLAAYSNASPGTTEIRYFNFATSSDTAISNLVPGGQAIDLLSDVNQNRIVFTRIFPDSHAGIMLFDTATASLTELAPSPITDREGVALGSQTVAFIDRGLQTAGELVVHDLTSLSTTRLTTDTDVDNFPAVSPDGTVISWEHCATSCDIWKAVKTGANWVVSPVTSTADSEHNPDATATTIVYEGLRASSTTGPNLYLSPVAGGPEQELSIPGDEYNPSIRGNVIAFEHREPTASDSDLYVYDLATNRLFQITNTPTISETLNDVTILPDGKIRVVWAANDDLDGVSRNIYGATFTLPSTGPTCQNRSQTLTATRTGRGQTSDGFATFNPAFGFALPRELTITSGAPSYALAQLTFSNAAAQEVARCYYLTPFHERERLTLALCLGNDRRVLRPGAIVSANTVRLHLSGGTCDRSRSFTVQLPLSENCSTPVWPGAGGGCHHDDDDGEGDDVTSRDVTRAVSAGLEAPGEGAGAAGCSSSAGLVWPALLALVAALLFRRSRPIRVEVRSRARRLMR